MALSTPRRNAIAITALVACYIAIAQWSESNAAAYRDVPWERSLALLVAEFVAFGAVSFFAFGGGFWVRSGLTVCVPAISQAVLEVIWGSDPAYPYLTLWLALPISVLFFFGALVAGGPYMVWRDWKRRSHLTPQSSGRV